uniref:Uncharacterized protein n=1 Tax=Kalanchoe fedtschenkoi TaxID=63787 RepID=A0A7N0UW94_KALFE
MFMRNSADIFGWLFILMGKIVVVVVYSKITCSICSSINLGSKKILTTAFLNLWLLCESYSIFFYLVLFQYFYFLLIILFIF